MKEIKINSGVAFSILSEIKEKKVNLAIKTGISSVLLLSTLLIPGTNGLLIGFGAGMLTGSIKTYRANIKKIADKYGIEINLQKIKELKEIEEYGETKGKTI